MHQQLVKHDINFDFIDAVDGRTLSEKELKTLSSRLKMLTITKAAMTRGEIGCALSHIKTYQTIVEKSIEYALILEDDTLINKDTKNILQLLSNQFSFEEETIVCLNPVKWYKKNNLIKLTENYRIADLYDPNTMGAMGYFITLAAAKKLHKNLLPVFTPADHWFYFNLHFIKVKVLIPHCVDYSPLTLISSIDSIENRHALHNSENEQKSAPFSLKTIFMRKQYQFIKSCYKSFRNILAIQQIKYPVNRS